jgi:hypothetical protein
MVPYHPLPPETVTQYSLVHAQHFWSILVSDDEVIIVHTFSWFDKDFFF